MDETLNVVLPLLAAAVIISAAAFSVGLSAGAKSVQQDCEKLGKFWRHEQVYECKKVTP